MTKEIRPLTKLEIERLMREAPEEETRFLKEYKIKDVAYDFFQKYALDQEGLVIDKRPIYFGAIVSDENGGQGLWTVVNSNVKEQLSLFKVAKQTVNKWVNKYGKITAEMHKGNDKNARWTKRLGFKILEESKETKTFVMGG